MDFGEICLTVPACLTACRCKPTTTTTKPTQCITSHHIISASHHPQPQMNGFSLAFVSLFKENSSNLKKKNGTPLARTECKCGIVATRVTISSIRMQPSNGILWIFWWIIFGIVAAKKLLKIKKVIKKRIFIKKNYSRGFFKHTVTFICVIQNTYLYRE